MSVSSKYMLPLFIDSLNREFCSAEHFYTLPLLSSLRLCIFTLLVYGSHLNVFWTGVVFTTFVTSRLKILKLVLQGVKGAQEANFHILHIFIHSYGRTK